MHHLCDGSTLPPVVRVESCIFRDGQRYYVKLQVGGVTSRFPCGVGAAGLARARQRRDEVRAAEQRHESEPRCAKAKTRLAKVLALASAHAGPVNLVGGAA